MKKLFTIFLLLTLCLTLLASCGNNNNNQEMNANIYTLNGTTGFGMAKLMHDESANENSHYTFTVESDASVVSAALINGDCDIACLPTNAAANLFNKTNGKIQILAVNTRGCLYLLNTGSTAISSLADLNGKTVYAPSQNPTFILQYLVSAYQVNITIDNTYSSASDLKDAVASGKVEFAVLPEPMVTVATAAAKKNSITVTNALDLTALWDALDGKNGTLVQGCVVVRKQFAEQNPDFISAFLQAYQASITYLSEDVDNSAKYIVEAGIFTNETVAKTAIPKCNVCYLDGEEMKTAMNTYLSVLYTIAPNSIGGKMPTDDFYFLGK